MIFLSRPTRSPFNNKGVNKISKNKPHVSRAAMAFSLDGDFPAVNGDETLLRQAFLNLLRNARQAVRAVREDGGEVHVRGAVSDDGRVGLEISDNGVGIEEQNLDRIFLPFFTTREEGTGLGLALVQKIILSHNGTIQVNSRPGEGTSFRITLPPHQPELSDNQG